MQKNTIKKLNVYLFIALFCSCTEEKNCPSFNYVETQTDTTFYFSKMKYASPNDTIIFSFERDVMAGTKKVSSISNVENCKDGFIVDYVNNENNRFYIQFSNTDKGNVYIISSNTASSEVEFKSVDEINLTLLINETYNGNFIKKLIVQKGVVVEIYDTNNTKYKFIGNIPIIP